MKPLVSILIPCFNAERFIDAAIQSILLQTYSRLEIIAVDDGSTDKSIDILRRYIHRGVKVMRQDNRGAAAARNFAFSRSTGELVLFMDADDLIEQRHIEALVERIAGSEAQIATSELGVFVNRHDEAKFWHPSYCDLDGVSWLVTDWTGAQTISQCGMFLIPRQLVEQIGGWNEKLSSWDDVEFFSRLFCASAGTLFSPDARLYYRTGAPDRLSTRVDRNTAELHLLSISLSTKHLLSAENSDRTRRASADIFRNFEYTYFPYYPDLRAKARKQLMKLGGSDLVPHGRPRFHTLRRLVGWRAALVAQKAYTELVKYRK